VGTGWSTASAQQSGLSKQVRMAPFPCVFFALDGIARWRLLERKRSPAIREVTPIESPLSRLQHASSRSESLPAPDLSSWPMFDPCQYWHAQTSLDFLPGLTPSVEQLEVQPPSHTPRAAVPIPSSGGGDFRTTPSMVSAYRYPASFDHVFTTLEPTQGIDYAEPSEMHVQADIPELRTNVTSDLDARSDSSSVSALQHDVEMDAAIITQLDVGSHDEESLTINEPPLDNLDSAVSDYDNCRLPSPPPEDVPSEPVSPVITSPVERSSQQTQPMEISTADHRLPRLSSTLATSSE
jgi:hypothetical protein